MRKYAILFLMVKIQKKSIDGNLQKNGYFREPIKTTNLQ